MLRLLFNKVSIGLALLIAAGWFGWKYFAKEEAGSLTSGIVSRKDIIQRVTISGLIVPNRSASISAPYDGYIQRIFVKIGQNVKQGDPIVTVSQTPDGRGENPFPLRSPFAGRVVQILKSEGADVVKGNTQDSNLVRIDDTSKLFVVSDTPEMDFPKLKLGQHTVIKASSIPDKTYNGEIIELFEAARTQERWNRSKVEFPIKVHIIDKDNDLKAGMSVTMDIITAEAKNALALRHDYVGRRGDEYFVVLKDGTKKNVTVGMRSEDAFEIVDGINVGDEVQQVDFLSLSNSVNSKRHGKHR